MAKKKSAAAKPVEDAPIVNCPTCSAEGQRIYGLHWDEMRKNPIDAFACDNCKVIYFQ